MKKIITTLMTLSWGIFAFSQPFNNYLNLDGLDDYVQDDFTGSNMPSGDFTVEFWVYSCEQMGYKLIDAGGSTAGSGFEMNYSHNGGGLSAQVRGGHPTGGSVSYSSTPTTAWRHVAVVNNSTAATLSLYINGVLVDTSPVTGYNPSSRFFIGRMDYTTSGYLKVNIDEMRISDVVRYSTNFTPPTTEFSVDANTKALYHFNEAAGQINFLDATTNNYDLLGHDGATTISASLGTSATVPTISAMATSLCEGDSTKLSITGGTLNDNEAWEWYSASCGGTLLGTGDSIYVTPTTNTTYYARGAGGCANNGNCAAVAINVTPAFTVTASVSDNVICSGDSILLNATGATTYTWDNGGIHNTLFAPNGTTTYTVTGTTNGCTATDQVQITVNTRPNVTANSSAATVCAGDSIVLTATGNAITYTWSNGVTDGLAFGINATTTYSVTGSNAFCSATDDVTVTVNELPIVNANASNSSICQGDQVTLFGTGDATNYIWNNGVVDGTAFGPTSTTTYTVTGTNSFCSATDELIITVNSLPVVNANASNAVLCAGDSVVLTASGDATSYSWDNGVVDGVAVVPNSSTTYTVSGTNMFCSADAQVTITVNPLPTVNANASNTSVCENEEITLFGTGTATNYIWDNGVIDGVAFSPSTTTYTVTGTDGNCVHTAQIAIVVNTIDVSTNTVGSTLSANQQGATYQWVDCDNGNSELVGATNADYTATENGNYAVIISMNGCVDTSSCITVTSVGVEDMVFTDQVTIYPNPTKGNVMLSFGNLAAVSVTLYTLTGEIVYQATNITTPLHQLELNSAPGCYILELNAAGKTQQYKLIKE
ncbi:MAG: T9SS type A sorting domain-containing protein [Flavobacteriales bacterium]|jgi:hypothetical protein|nr:T9SS type A sorting domain-containing protein [Flavobacteriales bacterium]